MQRQLVLCCAEDDEPRLAPAMAELHRMGRSPELVGGLDQDPMRLGAVIDAQHEPTLYVLCESELLNARAIRQAQGVLGARKGPDDEVLVVELGASPLDVARAVVSQSEQPIERAAPPETESHLLRDVVKLAPAEAGPKVEAAEPIPEAKPAFRSVREGSNQSPGRRIPGASAHVPPEVAERALAAAAAAQSAADGDGDEVEVELDGAPPPPSRRRPSFSNIPRAVHPAGSGRSVTSMLVLFGLFLAAAGTAWLLLRVDAQSGSRGARGAPGVAAVDPSVESAEADAGETGDAGEQEALAAGDAAPEGSAQAVKDAVALGELRVLDLLYIVPPVKEDLDYEGAVEYCASLRIAGLPGFRLPGVDEIKSIRYSHMLEAGRYWSSKSAGPGFGFVLDTSAGSNLVRARRPFRTARALCVRSH